MFGTCTDIDDQKQRADNFERQLVASTTELATQKALFEKVLKELASWHHDRIRFGSGKFVDLRLAQI